MKDGGPAFPMGFPEAASNAVKGERDDAMGMSLRDYFAATVGTADLVGIKVQADREALAGMKQPEPYDSGIEGIKFNMKVEAALRYLYADAMLKERDK